MLRNHQLGFSLDASGRSFQSWLYVEEDGAIVVVEQYSFLGQQAREETKPGYSDHLFIPASYFETFLLLVAQKCQRDVAPREDGPLSPDEERVRMLFELLDSLKGKQKLERASSIGKSHRTLRRWLIEAAIPYEVVRSVWHTHSDDEHGFIEATSTGRIQRAVEELVARMQAPARRAKRRTSWFVAPPRTGEVLSPSQSPLMKMVA